MPILLGIIQGTPNDNFQRFRSMSYLQLDRASERISMVEPDVILKQQLKEQLTDVRPFVSTDVVSMRWHAKSLPICICNSIRLGLDCPNDSDDD